MKFRDDWRGVFIRGDNAFGWRLTLEYIIDYWNPTDPEGKLRKQEVVNLSNLLDMTNEGVHDDTEASCQHMKTFGECVIE